ncbi:MAG: Ig-like domain-containing protein, partial [Solobacterium sp.]|nr:Ig-like domain-containing protein [Solobacterium sp.]
GSAVYAENAPKSSEAEITFDVSKAITDASGYVAVYAGDYAGNESAVAIKVNDNAQSGKTVYVLTSVMEAGSDYLIVSSGSKGTANALNHSGTTAGKFTVTVKAGTSETNGQPYIESENISSTGVWTSGAGSNGTYTFVNSNQYLSNSNNTLVISNSPGNWNWDGTNNRLSINNRYLRYSNNSFSLYNSARSVYLYRKTVLNGSDPYSISSVTITPNTVELYKGSTSSLNADIAPLTASDRSVTWTSSNPQIASVDANGLVTAVSAGTATIRATSNGDPSKYAECSVTVVSVNKALNGIVWDENGEIYFSSFNTSSLPVWNKLHTSAVDQELQNAFMADTSTLYASTCDASDNTSVIYKVNRSNYDLTEFGTNYVPAFGMARALSRYTDYFVYGYATFIIMGNLTPESDEEIEGTYSGLPYGVLDLTETSVGDSYVCGICARNIGTNSSGYYFLDETGKIWQTTLTIGSSATFSSPTLVIDTGIGTSFLYQSLYYDGTYIYWSHCDGETDEMIIIDPTSKAVYHAGDFGEGVWPVSGLYVDGKAAPASEGAEPEETENETLQNLTVLASRDELLTDEVKARFAAEAEKMSKKKSTSSGNTGSLNKVSAVHTSRRNRRVNAEVQYVEDDSDTAAITFTEGTDETNGVAEISYDPAKVSYVETVKAEDVILSVNPHFEKEDGSSVVRIAYALKKTPKERDLICTVKFLPCENSEITVTPVERGRDLAIKDERITSSVAGTGHSWTGPVWNWNGKSAKAVFTCSTDENHVQTIEAAVTETEGTGEDAGYTICTAAAEFNGREYTNTKKISSVPVFASHTLVLSGEIGVTFYMDLSMLSEDERKASRMEFTVNGKTAVAAYDPAFTNPSSHEYYGFTCYVNSLQMAEKIKAVFHYGNDKNVENEYSVKDYILSMHEKKESYSAEAVALAEAIADYGHYAQIFLKDVNNLGDKYAEMDTVYAQKYDISDVISKVDEYSLLLNDPASVIGKVQMRLSLDSETAISVRLTPKNNAELTATASLNGKTFNAEKQNDGTYIIRITGIKASQLGDVIMISGNEGQFTVTVSALAYVRSILNSESYKDNEKAQNAMAALYNFYIYTKNYQESLKKL